MVGQRHFIQRAVRGVVQLQSIFTFCKPFYQHLQATIAPCYPGRFDLLIVQPELQLIQLAVDQIHVTVHREHAKGEVGLGSARI